MTKYKQEVLLLDTEFDEIGRRYSLSRFQEESISNFRDRIYLSTLNPPKPTYEYYNFAINNFLNLFQKNIFKISLIDSHINIEDLPRVEVTPIYLIIWKEQSKEPVLKLNLYSKEYKFLKDVKVAIETLSFLELEVFKDYDPYAYSKNIFQQNSDGLLTQVFLEVSQFQNLGVRYIEKYLTNNPLVSLNKKDSQEELSEDGDFYLDKKEGLLYTYQENTGFAEIRYQTFPFHIGWGPVNFFEFNHEDVDFLTKDKQVDIDGNENHTVLNSYGGNIINRILEDNKIYWGI